MPKRRWSPPIRCARCRRASRSPRRRPFWWRTSPPSTRADLKAGQSLLVVGAAGGVGLAAVEIGKVLGARVIAAASSPDKLAAARCKGADHVIDYTREPIEAAVGRATGGLGADV